MKKLVPSSPGRILLQEFIQPLGLTQYRVAKDAGITHPTMSAIIHSRRSIGIETALRLARYFGTTPQFWLNLQSNYELRMARRQRLDKKIAREVKPMDAAAA
jgi:addiction module HigA family antidote